MKRVAMPIPGSSTVIAARDLYLKENDLSTRVYSDSWYPIAIGRVRSDSAPCAPSHGTARPTSCADGVRRGLRGGIRNQRLGSRRRSWVVVAALAHHIP